MTTCCWEESLLARARDSLEERDNDGDYGDDDDDDDDESDVGDDESYIARVDRAFDLWSDWVGRKRFFNKSSPLSISTQ